MKTAANRIKEIFIEPFLIQFGLREGNGRFNGFLFKLFEINLGEKWMLHDLLCPSFAPQSVLRSDLE